MYCIKCGVELADSEEYCPLCGTVPYHPDIKQSLIEKPYPLNAAKIPDTVNIKGILFLITVGFVICAIVSLICDLKINSTVIWSGFAIGGLALFYSCSVLPSWFKKPNPVIFVPVFFALATLYLLYISLALNGGWFLSFAFPVAGTLGLIVTAAVTLFKYLKKGYLYISGGLIISLGFFTVLIEFLIRITFKTGEGLPWSLYPLTVGLLVGLALIIIAICRPLRISLHKKFFL